MVAKLQSSDTGSYVTNSKPSTVLPETVPVSSYVSVVTVHTTLWAFAALCLPRTSFLFTFTTPSWDPVQLSSRDHPQHPFFEALTLNPTHTLAWLAVGAAFLQSWWAGWLRQWWIEMTIQGTDAERRMERARYEHLKFQAFKDAWIATVLSSFATHVVLVLFGAPITSYIVKTYLLALLISIMTVYCPAFAIGIPSLTGATSEIQKNHTWVRLFVELSTENVVEKTLVYQAIGTLAGSWTGVIPIALDWDRPWQAWPLTPAFCAIGGYIIASLTALIVSIQKHGVIERSRLLADGLHHKID